MFSLQFFFFNKRSRICHNLTDWHLVLSLWINKGISRSRFQNVGLVFSATNIYGLYTNIHLGLIISQICLGMVSFQIYLLNFFLNNETLKEKDYRWEFYCLLLHLIMKTRNIFMVFIASCHKDCSFFYSFHGDEEDWSCKSCLLKKG